MEIKNILSELEIYIKNEVKGIQENEYKLMIRKQSLESVTKKLDGLLKPEKEDNGTT
jgi:hypothetical protein